MHSSWLPKLEHLPRNGAVTNQSNESSAGTYAFLFFIFLCRQNLNLPRNGRMPTNQMRARVRVGTKFGHSTVEWRGACTCWWKVIKTSCSIWDYPGTNWPPTDGRSNPLGNLLLHECCCHYFPILFLSTFTSCVFEWEKKQLGGETFEYMGAKLYNELPENRL